MEKLALRFNEPAQCALASTDGKEVPSSFNGTEVMFTLVDGRRLYADAALADAIENMRPRKGQPIELLKKKVAGNVVYSVTPVAVPQQHTQAQNIPANTPFDQHMRQALASKDAPQEQSTPLGTQMSRRLMGALLCSVNAALEVETYAQRKGMTLQFQAEDIRAMAISVYIQNCKEGGVL